MLSSRGSLNDKKVKWFKKNMSDREVQMMFDLHMADPSLLSFTLCSPLSPQWVIFEHWDRSKSWALSGILPPLNPENKQTVNKNTNNNTKQKQTNKTKEHSQTSHGGWDAFCLNSAYLDCLNQFCWCPSQCLSLRISIQLSVLCFHIQNYDTLSTNMMDGSDLLLQGSS